jgi:hypothetical protein
MDPMLEDLALATITHRLSDAQGVRRGRRHVAAGRLARRAEDAVRRASLALARAD